MQVGLYSIIQLCKNISSFWYTKFYTFFIVAFLKHADNRKTGLECISTPIAECTCNCARDFNQLEVMQGMQLNSNFSIKFCLEMSDTEREKAGVPSGDYVSVNTDFIQAASGCRTVPYNI